jgi:hypothetical protein
VSKTKWSDQTQSPAGAKTNLLQNQTNSKARHLGKLMRLIALSGVFVSGVQIQTSFTARFFYIQATQGTNKMLLFWHVLCWQRSHCKKQETKQ